MIRRGNSESAIALDVKSLAAMTAATPDDLVWRLLGLKTLPVASEYVSSVSPKLRGGLYIQAVSPGSPAAQAALEKGDILVGMNVVPGTGKLSGPITSSTCCGSPRPRRRRRPFSMWSDVTEFSRDASV